MAKRTTSATRKPAAPKADAANTGIPEGLPSATATAPHHARPEPKPVEGGATSSSAEASIASKPSTETGQATVEGETGAPSEAAPVSPEEPKPAAPSSTIVSGDSPSVQTTDVGQDKSEPEQRVFQGIVRITSRIEGFRRAGMRHSKTPVDHLAADFTVEQLDQLDDEPNLKVEYL